MAPIFGALSLCLIVAIYMTRHLSASRNKLLFTKTLLVLFFNFALIASVVTLMYKWLGQKSSNLILITFFSIFLLLELALRIIRSRSLLNSVENKKRRESARFDDFETIKMIEPHQNSSYLTREFWDEMQRFTGQGSVTKIKSRDGTKIFDAKEINGNYISAKDGFRQTTDRPRSPDGRVFLLGGSTVYCFEVPDSLTVCSFLQRNLNDIGKNLEVVNLGISGASVANRVEKLKTMHSLCERDIVIFLFGVNDIGWKYFYSNQNIFLKVIRNFGKVSLCFSWLYYELSANIRKSNAELAAHRTINQLEDVSDFLNTRKLSHKFIIQPNIYTKQNTNNYEDQIVLKFGAELNDTVLHAYRVFKNCQHPPCVSASHIIDNTETSVYLDWAHTNAEGNKLIANFISELDLFKR
jgi:lysophospholipase L1-like esterase